MYANTLSGKPAEDEENIMTQQLERKSLDNPDEVRPFKDNKGKAEIVTVGETILGRGGG